MTDQAFKQAMRIAELESDMHALRGVATQMRHFLACALCTECGEPLGDGSVEIICEDDRTMHETCKPPDMIKQDLIAEQANNGT
jgi:hypothetical protein